MKNVTDFILKRGLFLLLFSAFTMTTFALDDVIEIQKITAGDTYPDGSVNPIHLINSAGLHPYPSTDIENTTYGIPGWNCWHTSGNDNSKAWLLLDIGKSISVSKIYIWNMNQYNNQDRDIKEITITYSADSNDGQDGTWQKAGDYTIPQSVQGNGTACKAQSVIQLNALVRFVKIQAKSSYGSPYWGLGKIIMLQDHSQDTDRDLVELRLLQKFAKTHLFYHYTNDSWKPFALAMETAQALIDQESKDTPSLIAAKEALQQAMDKLVVKTNLAVGSTATANAFYGQGYEAKNAIDGQFNTRWASTNGTDFWFQIDLGVEKEFNQLMIFETPQYSGRIERSPIYVSNNGTDWTLWREKYWSQYYVSIVGESVVARYVKVELSDCSSEGINIDEIMLFKDDSAIETGEPTAARPIDPSWIKQESATSANVYQIRKANLKYGMFIHYGINTFIGQEWTDGSYHPSTYHPNLETLDPESWVKAAYEGGMNFVVLVAKHHEGFALWNTKIGTYNINNTGREGDQRDIVKEVSQACKKYGIKFGLYYSSWDRNWDANHTQQITGLDRVAINQLYNDFALAQITELLDGRYGEVSELWIDGAWVKRNADWEFPRLYDTVKKLQPTCQFGVNLTIKDVFPDQAQGGEEIYFFPSDFRLKDPFFTRPGANADPKIYAHQSKDYYLPFEATICINNTWFWTPGQNIESVMKPADIAKAYHHMVEQNNTLVMNLAPNKDGLFNTFDIDGLYAGARALGIARGNARNNIAPDECVVEVRFLTKEGNVAYPTRLVYGNKGDDYSISAQDLREDGYRLVSEPGTVNGKFNQLNTVVDFIYEDTGISEPTAISEISDIQKNKVFVKDNKIFFVCGESAGVSIYNPVGTEIGRLDLQSADTKSFDATHLHGLYLLRFTAENNQSYTRRVILH